MEKRWACGRACRCKEEREEKEIRRKICKGIVEGIACYVVTMQKRADHHSNGSPLFFPVSLPSNSLRSKYLLNRGSL